MKNKLLMASLFCATLGFSGELENGVQNLMKTKANMDIKVVKTVDINSGLKFVIAEDKSGMQFPLLATSNGDTVTTFSREFITSNDALMQKISTNLQQMSDANQKQTDKQAQNLYKQIPANGVLKLDNGKSKTIVIVSDPECPYCRNELANLETKLKDANVYMIFAPVHGKSAFVKSDLIYQKAAKAKTNEEKIKIIKEYYNPNVKLTDKEMAMQPVITEKNADIIFKSGIVKGVPFIFDLSK